nr:DUF805 domain-containing protein [uncultured Enterobacter sp.]
MWFVKYFFANYFNFNGRTSRRTFWCYTLTTWFIFLVIFVPEILQLVRNPFINSYPVFSITISVVGLIPNLAIKVRRLHDANRSGWWCLLAFVPKARLLATIGIGLLKSSEGFNDYGYPEESD